MGFVTNLNVAAEVKNWISEKNNDEINLVSL